MTADTCTDCGNAPVHPDSPCSYCRQCAEKAGYGYAFVITIDKDKARVLFGTAAAEHLFERCRA